MVDRKLEENIKKAEDFTQIWKRFRRVFERALSEGHVGRGEEDEFMSVRNLVNSRYEDLMDSLGVKPLRRFIIGASVCNILSLEKLSIMSDERLKSVAEDWRLSEEFLNALTERLKRKKKRIEGFNKLFILTKRRIRRK